MHRLLALATAPLLVALLVGVGPATGRAVGEPAVSVVGLDGNAETTSAIVVQLFLTWPEGAEQVAISNGDGSPQVRAVADVVSWQLVPLSAHEAGAVRTVTVTYSGPSIPSTTRSDTIVLDTRAPRIPRQRLFKNGRGWFVAVGAEDAGSGVAAVVLQGRSGQPLQTSVTCPASPCPPSTLQTYFARHVRPRNVRVSDGAHNAKAKVLVRRETSCSPPDGSYPVFKATDRFYDCVEEGDRCRPDDGHFWNRSAYVRCRRGDGPHLVVPR